MSREVIADLTAGALALRLTSLEPGEGFAIGGQANEAYHRGPGLSVSGAKRILKTPFHYHELAKPHDAPPKAPTPAMVNGTLVHCALLEPEEFDKRYWIGPDVDKRSKAWKEYVQTAEANGVELITKVQRDAAMRQAGALRALPEVAELLNAQGGAAEQSVYWRDVAHGLLLKCRPDWKAPVGYGRGMVLLDVKTAADASPEGFAKACGTWGYFMQDPWYCDGVQAAEGVEVHGMVFAVVESEYPHAAKSYMLGDESRDFGRKRIAVARARYAQCLERDEWPGYGPGIQVIDLPRWAFSAANL